tara:strand:+ start:196 stop:462 length:267 start_codon:yes stop_codon:yes gene_type:complete
MAKDRFSKFKPINYNKEFKYGTDGEMNHYVIPNRKKLKEKGRNYIINLIKICKDKFNIKFLRSILVQDKKPTKKQETQIVKIINNTNK